jgi:glycosyltransferase involved in cell wall biosynthesis
LGKAVVSTTLGAEGLPVHPGQHILIADDPEEFADTTIDLLRDPTQREELGQTARELVNRTYSWDAVVQPFETVLNMLVSEQTESVNAR